MRGGREGRLAPRAPAGGQWFPGGLSASKSTVAVLRPLESRGNVVFVFVLFVPLMYLIGRRVSRAAVPRAGLSLGEIPTNPVVHQPGLTGLRFLTRLGERLFEVRHALMR